MSAPEINPSEVEGLTPDLHGHYTRRRPQPARKGELYAALLTSEVHYQQASVPPQAAAWGRFSRTLHRTQGDEFGGCVDAEFGADSFSVTGYGPDADAQSVSDLFARLALPDEC
jgi:hypothetical protein